MHSDALNENVPGAPAESVPVVLMELDTIAKLIVPSGYGAAVNGRCGSAG